MASFRKFIFTIIIAGAVVNLGIVLLANARSHAAQNEQRAVERERFAQIMKVLNNKLRRGDMAVEWQRIDANQNVIETSLLIRQYMPQEDAAVPLPTTRIIIPGNRVCIDGLKLYFDDWFNPEYHELRDTTLFYFNHVYADGIPKKKRFTFLPTDRVPFASQVHNTSKKPHATYFENKLWASLWPMVLDPASTKAETRGLSATWIEPACKIVKGGAVYRITVGLEGVTISEDEQSFGRTARDEMLAEMKPTSSAPGPQK